jgi:hypothetical protein
MNLRLLAMKNDSVEDYSKGYYLRLVVVDMDKAKDYPANYVCMLPERLGPNTKFSRLFGYDSLDLAKELLSNALKSVEDPELKEEIHRRLRLVEPKPIEKVKCRICGSLFEPRRGRYKQTVCSECKQKKYGRK